MSTDKINNAVQKLPKEVKDNALALVKKMDEKIEGIGDEAIDWRPDTLKIVQAVSDRSKLPKGSNIGDLILGENILGKPVNVIPLRVWDTRQYWSPDQTEAKLLCSSHDAVIGYIGQYCKTCQFAKYDEEAKKSPCNKSKTVLAITADLKQVFLMNFSKTNYANGLDWVSLMKKAGVGTYRRTYAVKSQTSQKYKNVESILVDPVGTTPDGYYEFLDALFEKFSADRKIFLDAFHKSVLEKKQNQALLGGGNDSNLISVNNEVPPPTEQQKEQGTKYQL